MRFAAMTIDGVEKVLEVSGVGYDKQAGFWGFLLKMNGQDYLFRHEEKSLRDMALPSSEIVKLREAASIEWYESLGIDPASIRAAGTDIRLFKKANSIAVEAGKPPPPMTGMAGIMSEVSYREYWYVDEMARHMFETMQARDETRRRTTER